MMKGGADKQCSLSSVMLLAVPEAASSNTKAKSTPSAQLSLQTELCLQDAFVSGLLWLMVLLWA